MKTILASVSDKTGLVELLQAMRQVEELRILATGSTAQMIQNAGLPCETVESLTGFPEILDGRVKTLHPKVFGGILAQNTPEHQSQCQAHGITPIDIVIVNLYPFAKVMQSGAPSVDIIENIDIGGVALIRAAAKNFDRVAVLSDPSQYTGFIEQFKTQGGQSSPAFLQTLARQAFEHTAQYDALISAYFQRQEASEALPAAMHVNLQKAEDLRYGENPQQRAAWYLASGQSHPYQQLQGKEMSANNIVDAFAAYQVIKEFPNNPACCIIKHNNPCGAAIGHTIEEAYHKAYNADPISAFGGIFALNRTVSLEIADAISNLFIEIIMAPDFTPEALERLSIKKNVRVLTVPGLLQPHPQGESWMLKDLGDFGMLVQENTPPTVPELTCVTQNAISNGVMGDIAFAWSIVRHLTSNAIVIVKDGVTIGFGIGQTSRIASVEIALAQAGENARGAVLASDGFFPATDNIDAAANAGISIIVQPGGSIKDPDVIEAANQHGLVMLLTHERCFKH